MTDGTTETDASMNWTSSNPAVATVSAAGLITTKKAGQTTITATAEGVSATFTFTVTAPAVARIGITSTASSVPLGLTAQLTATCTMTDGTTETDTTMNWVSLNTAVATVSSTGLITTHGPGQTTITASANGVSATFNFTVAPPAVSQIAIASSNAATVPLGFKPQLTATCTMTDGTTETDTSMNWVSSDPSVATISATGLVTTKGVGQTTITATADSVAAIYVLTVTAATLNHITLSPTTPSIALGLTQQFTAAGVMSDGSPSTLTDVVWKSSDITVATISTTGLVTTLKQGTTTIEVDAGGKTASTTLTVNAAVISSISISPANPTINVGGTQQFAATAAMTDSTTQTVTTTATWSSSATANATMDSTTAGLAHGVAAGTSTITATQGGVTGNTVLTVQTASTGAYFLTWGYGPRFTAYPIRSDGTLDNYGTVASPYAPPMRNSGSAVDNTGTFFFNVSYNVMGSQAKPDGTLSLVPGSPFNDTETMQAQVNVLTAHPLQPVLYAGGFSYDSETRSNYNYVVRYSFDPNTGVMDNAITDGGAGFTPGSVFWFPNVADAVTEMRATADGKFLYAITTDGNPDAPQYTIHGWPLDGVGQLSTHAEFERGYNLKRGIAVDTTGKYVYIGHYDGDSSNVNLYYIDESGALVVHQSAVVSPKQIQAMVFDTRNNLLYVGVGDNAQNGELVVFKVDPGDGSLNKLNTQALDSGINPFGMQLTVAPTGVHAALYMGAAASDTFTYTVYSADVSTGGLTRVENLTTYGGSGQLVLTPRVIPVLDHISLSPTTPSVALGRTLQFTAVGIMTDNNTKPLTSPVWTSSDTLIATIDNTGLVTAKSQGTTTIEVDANGLTASTVLTVGPADIVSISITPMIPSVSIGGSQQFMAIANLSNATTQNVTANVIWSSSAPVAAIDSTTPGMVHGVANGSSIISATLSGISASTFLTVMVPGQAIVGLAYPLSSNYSKLAEVRLWSDGTQENLSTSPLTGVYGSCITGVSAIPGGPGPGYGPAHLYLGTPNGYYPNLTKWNVDNGGALAWPNYTDSPGVVPADIAASPSGNFLYLLSADSSGTRWIDAYSLRPSDGRPISSKVGGLVYQLPLSYTGDPHIGFDLTGSTMYVAGVNGGGQQGIQVLHLDATSGAATQIQDLQLSLTPSGGMTPDSSGQYFLVALSDQRAEKSWIAILSIYPEGTLNWQFSHETAYRPFTKLRTAGSYIFASGGDIGTDDDGIQVFTFNANSVELTPVTQIVSSATDIQVSSDGQWIYALEGTQLTTYRFDSTANTITQVAATTFTDIYDKLAYIHVY
jgi:uncharacterized protein YjdB/6-phosphogluconolactonase (cycloisomerase 2 family)